MYHSPTTQDQQQGSTTGNKQEQSFIKHQGTNIIITSLCPAYHGFGITDYR